MNNLLATTYAWVLDLVFFLVLLIGLIVGAKRGFLSGICKLAGTIFAILFAFMFCGNFETFCQTTFGLRDLLVNVVKEEKIAQLLGTILSFIVLFFVIKFGTWLLNKMLSGVVESVGVLKVINIILGAALGILKTACVLFILFAILYWINNETVNEMISASKVVSLIYNGDWFKAAISYLSNYFVKDTACI